MKLCAPVPGYGRPLFHTFLLLLLLSCRCCCRRRDCRRCCCWCCCISQQWRWWRRRERAAVVRCAQSGRFGVSNGAGRLSGACTGNEVRIIHSFIHSINPSIHPSINVVSHQTEFNHGSIAIVNERTNERTNATLCAVGLLRHCLRARLA